MKSNNLVAYFIIFLESLYGITYYLFKRSSTRTIYIKMVRAHCVTNGLSTEIVNRVVNFIEEHLYKKWTVCAEPSEKILSTTANENEETQELIKCLKNDGYAIDAKKLDSRIVMNILAAERKLTGQLLDINNMYSENITLDEAKNSNPVRLLYYPDSIIEHCVDLEQIAKSAYFLGIAEMFLGTAPKLDTIVMWRSFVSELSEELIDEAAQSYHFDLDRLSWLKIFIYLTDVDTLSGPHCYVRGSHRRTNERANLLNKGYVRISDEDIYDQYSEQDIKCVVGSAGTIIYGNTKCFHKGEQPKNHERLVLELQYTSNNYGAQPLRFKNRRMVKEIFLSSKSNPRAFEYL